jgi:hypothetical protein
LYIALLISSYHIINIISLLCIINIIYYYLLIQGKGAKGTEGANAPAEKKKKVEGSEDDDAENHSHATAAFLVNEETNANSNGQVREISGDMNDVHNEQERVYQMYV